MVVWHRGLSFHSGSNLSIVSALHAFLVIDFQTSFKTTSIHIIRLKCNFCAFRGEKSFAPNQSSHNCISLEEKKFASLVP